MYGNMILLEGGGGIDSTPRVLAPIISISSDIQQSRLASSVMFIL